MPMTEDGNTHPFRYHVGAILYKLATDELPLHGRIHRPRQHRIWAGEARGMCSRWSLVAIEHQDDGSRQPIGAEGDESVKRAYD